MLGSTLKLKRRINNKAIYATRYRKGIVVLPAQDAVAATQNNANWAKKAMLRAWVEHANSGGGVARSRVKVDYLAALNS